MSGSIRVAAVLAGVLVVMLCGCTQSPVKATAQATTGASVATAPVSTSATVSARAASAAASAWRDQALMLGRTLQDVQDSLASGPEPSASTKPDGTFSAVVVSVDAASRTIVVDRTRLYTDWEQAKAAAKRDHVDIGEAGSYASNRVHERLTLKVAKDAAFVIYYPGDGALDVSPDEVASMSALTFDEFVAQYRTGSGTRGELTDVGAWITVSGGRVTSLVGLPYS